MKPTPLQPLLAVCALIILITALSTSTARADVVIPTAPVIDGQQPFNQVDTAPPPPGAGETMPVPRPAPDWGGIWLDTGLLFGSQAVAAGVLYVLPQDVSGWTEEQKRNSYKRYADYVVDPIIDKDKFYINYVLHPYWGGAYYTRARERGFGPPAAFAYSALVSAMYEFGVECFFEKPSIQDLLVTPLAGSLVGAFIFEPWRTHIKSKPELAWYDHAALVFTDPVGVLSNGAEKLFGRGARIGVAYAPASMQPSGGPNAAAHVGMRATLNLQMPIR